MKCLKLEIWFSFLMLGIGLGVFLFSSPAFGEFYKYVGPDGRIRFTDDYTQVPLEQRQSSKEYEEALAETSDPAQTVSKTKAADEPLTGSEDKEGSDALGVAEKELVETRSRLESRRRELTGEHEALMNEKNALESISKKTFTLEEVKAFNERAASFNTKIKDYEKRLEIHNQEAAAFNERIASFNQSIKDQKEKEKEAEK